MRDRSVWGIHDNCGPGTTDPSGCGFYRIVLPLDELAKHGWKAGYELGMPQYDPGVFVGQRFDQADIIPMWKTLKGHYGLVYEIDDDPFTVDRANWLAISTYGDSQVLDTIRECAAIADLVTVTTEPLAEVMRRFNPDVHVIPNYVPEALLATKRPRRDVVTMGWAGGVSHMRDLAMIAQTWRDVLDETGVAGHFVGANYCNMMRWRSFRVTPWQVDPREYYKLIDFDIGLIPIADVPFARSKSHVKALEFGALGIPVIASDCEAYRDYVIHGVTGYLVKTQREWREAMMTLISDEDLREKMGAAAREYARCYTIEANWWRWDEVYGRLL